MSRESDFSEYVNSALLYLEASPSGRGKRTEKPLRYFNGASPFFGKIGSAPSGFVMLPDDVTPKDVHDPDFTIMGNLQDSDDSSVSVGANLMRVRKVRNSKELRGVVPARISAVYDVFEISVAMIMYDSFVYESYRIGYFSRIRGKWCRVASTANSQPQPEGDIGEKIQLNLSVAFTMESFWTVDISMDGGLSLKLPTDAQGAREVFRLRDVRPGRTRRSALTHWVTEHTRKNRKNDGYHDVIKHLSGPPEFSWNGLVCKIAPSFDDMRAYKKYIESASNGR